jgi:hypothetical protein
VFEGFSYSLGNRILRSSPQTSGSGIMLLYCPRDSPNEQACRGRRLPIMRIITGVLIVAAAILIAVGGLVLVQRLYSTDQRKQHNDVAGFIYAVLGVA